MYYWCLLHGLVEYSILIGQFRTRDTLLIQNRQTVVKDLLSVVKDLLSVVKDLLSVVKDLLSVVKDLLSVVKDLLSVVKDAHTCRKKSGRLNIIQFV